MAAGSGERIQEVIAGIMEAVGAEDGFETAFVKACIMGHKRDIGRESVRFKSGEDPVFNLVPDIREQRSVFGVIGAESMDLLAEPGIIVRIGMDEAVERVHHFPVTHNHNPHGAYATGATVGSLKIQYDSSIQNSTKIRNYGVNYQFL